MSSDGNAEDFDVAKAIFEQLKGLSTERKERVLRWVAESLGHPSAIAQAQPILPASLAAPAVRPTQISGQDIKTFIDTKAPKSDSQFAAAVAYFHRFEAPLASRRETIDGKALQEAARLAGRKRLANPRVTLNNAKKAGYLDSGSSPGEFAINSVGENLVAMTLPGGKSPKRQRSAPAQRMKKKKKL